MKFGFAVKWQFGENFTFQISSKKSFTTSWAGDEFRATQKIQKGKLEQKLSIWLWWPDSEAEADHNLCLLSFQSASKAVFLSHSLSLSLSLSLLSFSLSLTLSFSLFLTHTIYLSLSPNEEKCLNEKKFEPMWAIPKKKSTEPKMVSICIKMSFWMENCSRVPKAEDQWTNTFTCNHLVDRRL